MDRDELLALDRGPLVELIVRLHERVAALEAERGRPPKARKLPTPFAAAAEWLNLSGGAEGLGCRDSSSIVTRYER